MKISDILTKNANDLPGYDLLGCAEIAVPVFIRKLHILAQVRKSIPVVEEFVLNFYNQGLDVDDISLILGLDRQLINEAWAGLIQKDYIDYISKIITDSGQKYIIDNQVDSLNEVEIKISVDGVTGYIGKDINNLMTTQSIKDKGIRGIKSNIDKPDIQSLDFNSVKKVFSKYKDIDNDLYNGDILDIVHMEGNTTKFRKIDVMLFQNNDKDTRIMAFEGLNKISDYEEKLFNMESKGISLFKYDFADYFYSDMVMQIDTLIERLSEEINHLQYSLVNNCIDEYYMDDDIIIVLPLVSECKVTDNYLDMLFKNVDEGKKINIIIAGRDFIDEYQKKIYSKLVKELPNHKGMKISHTPNYLNKMILSKRRKRALISKYIKYDVEYSGNKIHCIGEDFFEVKDDMYDSVNDIINGINYENTRPTNFQSLLNKETIRNKIVLLYKLVNDAEGYMYSNDEIGWFGEGELPDTQRFIEIPLATTNEKFRTFADSINKSLVESLDLNAKRNNNKDYFWKGLKDNYPQLQRVLEKIRIYRNRSNHLELTPSNKIKYYECLNEDLNGHMPEFVDQGYLIIQTKILEELEKAIINMLNVLK